jgi:ribosomal protein S18 acetylase RimI-like enzyme
MITVHKAEYTKEDSPEMQSLLTLFRNSLVDTDYMAIGEVDGMNTLKSIFQNKNLLHFIAYEDELPVGYCQVIYRNESINFHTGAKINAIAVLPNKRKLGVGSRLLEETILALKRNSRIKNIYLDVVKDNVIAIELYKKFNFEKVGELKNIFTKNNILMDVETYSLGV